ncbi:MAG: VWA domain-containing protein, partial [Hyphomicrobium sp.]
STSNITWQSLSNCRGRVRSITAYSSYTNAQAEQFCRDNFTTRVSNRTTQYWTPDRASEVVPRMVNRFLRTCVTERQGAERYTDAVPGSGSYVGVFNPSSTNLPDQYSSSTNNCTIPQIMTMTTEKQSLKDRIDTFVPLSGTAGHVGTAWSYYMLSPEWNRFWSEGHLDVAEYDNTNTIKAAVIMTDGEYNSNFSSPTASTQAIAICTEMKAKGITVYTIGFDMSTNVNDPARRTLMDCASPDKYYFPYDGNALKTAFNEIGNSLVTIVTKSSKDKTVLIQE